MDLTKEIKDLRPLDGGDLRCSSMIESLTPFLINLAIRNGLSDLGVKFL
jgi:predicted dinucleotide-binding enzyme